MATITYQDQQFELSEGQSVLSALLDRGYDIPNSCRAGVCQSCLMKALEGQVPAQAQQGLKDSLKSQGYFMACSCLPAGPLKIEASNSAELRIGATVIEHTLIGPDVLRLRLRPQGEFSYLAGQYLTLWKDGHVGRSYSLASVPSLDDTIELHIRKIEQGVVSRWLHHEVSVGDRLEIQNATGHCCYVEGQPEQKLLLAGTGTGLAPLLGILRDALKHGHKGEIQLIHGALQPEGLYLHQTLIELAESVDNLVYSASVLKPGKTEDHHISTMPLDKLTLQKLGEPSDCKVYLCGDVDTVNNLKKKLFISGVSMNNIYSDPFIHS